MTITKQIIVVSYLLLKASFCLGDNRIWLEDTKINDNPVKFIFDSGSDAMALSSEAVHRLGLKVVEAQTNGFGYTETCDMNWNGNLFQTKFLILNASPFAYADFDGIMGWPVLSSNIVQIDSDVGKLTFLKSAPPWVAHWNQFLVLTNIGTLDLEVPNDDGSKGVVSLDTGSDWGLALSSREWHKWKDAHRDEAITLRTYVGMDGFHIKQEAWADRIRIGSIILTDVPIMEEDSPVAGYWGNKHEGTLGLAALDHLNIVVDGIHSVAYVQPKIGSPHLYSYNRLGADFVPELGHKGTFKAVVIAGSPAYKAGIRNGDILLRVDAIPAIAWTDDWRSRFEMPPGTNLRLKLQRNGTNFETVATLSSI